MADLMPVQPEHATGRFDMLEEIMKFLFTTAEERLASEINELIRENSAIHESESPVMMYRGKNYNLDNKVVPGSMIHMLHKDLEPRMLEWLDDKSEIRTERNQINNLISCLMLRTQSYQGMLQIFPDNIHSFFEKHIACFGEETPDPQVIEDFKTEFKSEIETIRLRMVKNLINM